MKNRISLLASVAAIALGASPSFECGEDRKGRAFTRDNAFTFRMPAGIPGAISRDTHDATVEQQVIWPAGTTGAPFAYGLPLFLDAATGQARILKAGDTFVYGFLVRPFPLAEQNVTDGLGVATPPTSGICNVMRRGYINVTLNGATAAVKGGIVYVRLAAAGAGKPIGGIEAAADGGNTLALPQATCSFTGPADPSGNAEVAFNI